MDAEMTAYINSVSDERRQLYARLEGLVHELYPEAELVKSYGIPKYQIKTGGIFLNYWKGGVSMHGGGTDLLEDFKVKYPQIKTGKGGINFKVGDEIPESEVRTFITNAMQRKGAPGKQE
jgi:hypothetical protein